MNSLDNTGPLEMERYFLPHRAPFHVEEWPTIGPLPHVGEVRCPPTVAQLPRDRRGYPILYSLYREEDSAGRIKDPSKVSFLGIDPERVLRCGNDALCGVCGQGLFGVKINLAAAHKRTGMPRWSGRSDPAGGSLDVRGTNGMDIASPQRVYFIGGPASCERSRVFNDPPMHFACAMFALRVCPWMILARYKRVDQPDFVHSWAAVDETRPIKVGLLQATGYDLSPDLLFTAKFPVLLGYIAPQGWPTEDAMRQYWRDTTRAMAVKVFEMMRGQALQVMRAIAHAKGNDYEQQTRSGAASAEAPGPARRTYTAAGITGAR